MQANGYTRLSLNDIDDRVEILDQLDTARANTVEEKAPLRPHIYYDDGPFDAPSSESEDESLLEKDLTRERPTPRSPGAAENGFAGPKVSTSSPW